MNVDLGRRTDDGGLGAALPDCLSAAIAAPSIHNTQPWRFRVAEHHIDVLADLTRRLDVVDKASRELYLSLGAAVLNLRVAIAAHGRAPIMRLLPDAGKTELVARIAPGAAQHRSETTRLLARAIPQRRTNRRPFFAIGVPPEVIAELQAAAAIEGARLVPVDATGRDAVLGIVRTAEMLRRRDPAYRQELANWTIEVPPRRDGIPPAAYGPWSALESIPLRDFGLVQPARHRTTVSFEPEPTLAILYSAGDGPEQWLRAGQALERLWLTATVRGLATTLMTQPLEIPQLRSLFHDRDRGQAAQAILRFGYGPPAPPSPRRPLESFVMDHAPAARTGWPSEAIRPVGTPRIGTFGSGPVPSGPTWRHSGSGPMG